MQAEILKSAELYSGNIPSGLTLNGTFDRVLFIDRKNIRNSQATDQIIQSCLQHFKNSSQTRLVIRIVSSLSQFDLPELQSKYPQLEFDIYPDAAGEFNYLTISGNKPERSLPHEAIQKLHQIVREKVSKTLDQIGDYQSFALDQLNLLREQKLSLTNQIKPVELSDLWQPFDWTEQACHHLIKGQHNDIVLGIRDRRSNLLIAAALYNDQSHQILNRNTSYRRHGETTEWTTRPEKRHKNIIPALLIGFHSLLISRGIKNIWADLRLPDAERPSPNSISPAIKSGMIINTPKNVQFLSTNHVTIQDIPDTYNLNTTLRSSTILPQHLRTFVKAYVDEHILSPDIRSTYLQEINFI